MGTKGEFNLEVKINGQDVQVSIPPNLRLIDLLRDVLQLTGTKEGCGEGDCGACTVLLDGAPVNSCLVMAMQVVGHEVTTIEGVGAPGELSPIQQAFLDHGAVQCGYCTPGMVLTAKALLDANPRPTREEIRVAISGNLCRCTGYSKIVDAIESVAGEMPSTAAATRIGAGANPPAKGAMGHDD